MNPQPRLHHHLRLGAAAVVAGALLGACAPADQDSTAPTNPANSPGDAITMAIDARGSCPNPGDFSGGTLHLTINNRNDVPMGVSVVPESGEAQKVGSPDDPPLVAEIEHIASSESRTLELLLANGSYHLLCTPEETVASRGESFTVTNSPWPAPKPITAVGYPELDPLAVAYRDVLAPHVDAFINDAKALQVAINGDNAAARQAWTTAYLGWLRLAGGSGAIDAADDIDSDLMALQEGLFMPGSKADLPALAADLVEQASSIGTITVDPTDLAIRAHEITEDSQRIVLSGDADQGAHMYAAALSTQAEAAQELLELLRPLLEPRGDMRAYLDTTQALKTTADSLRKYDGTEYSQWPAAQRRELNGALDAQLAAVSPIATLLEVRRTK